MPLPRYISGRKYWYQNYLEHWKLLHTKAKGIRPTIVRGLLLLTLGLLRWVVRLAETYLLIEELDMAICYSLRGSAFGSSMIRCTRDIKTMLTFGSRLMRKNPRLVGDNDESGLYVIQAVYTEQPLKAGSQGNFIVDPWNPLLQQMKGKTK